MPKYAYLAECNGSPVFSVRALEGETSDQQPGDVPLLAVAGGGDPRQLASDGAQAYFRRHRDRVRVIVFVYVEGSA